MSNQRKTWMDGFFEGDDPPIDWGLVRAGGAGDRRFKGDRRRLSRSPDPRSAEGDHIGLITEEEVRRATRKK